MSYLSYSSVLNRVKCIQQILSTDRYGWVKPFKILVSKSMRRRKKGTHKRNVAMLQFNMDLRWNIKAVRLLVDYLYQHALNISRQCFLEDLTKHILWFAYDVRHGVSFVNGKSGRGFTIIVVVPVCYHVTYDRDISSLYYCGGQSSSYHHHHMDSPSLAYSCLLWLGLFLIHRQGYLPQAYNMQIRTCICV